MDSYFDFVKNYMNEIELNFFKKSLFIFALIRTYNLNYIRVNHSNYTTYITNSDNGLLNVSSANCINSVFSYNFVNDSTDESFTKLKFLKLVPINLKSDCIIFDIIHGIIFNNICSKYNNFLNHLTVYEYSFLSYYYKTPHSLNYWLYDTLTDYTKNTSPYYSNSLELVPIVYKKAYAVVSKAVTHISLYKLLSTSFVSNYEIKIILTTGYIHFFAFLSNLKTKYGFQHNDLHTGNIIYDITSNKLLLIDFGRSVFEKYMFDSSIIIEDGYDTELNNLNNSLICEIEKLNLKEYGFFVDIFKNIHDYKSLIDTMIIQSKYDSYNNQSTIIYPYAVLELLSLSLTFYTSLVLLFQKSNITTEYLEFSQYFKTIIRVEEDTHNFTIDAKSITELFKFYLTVKKTYINGILLSNTHKFHKYKQTLSLLLDGLFILALFLMSNNITQNIEISSHHLCIILENGTWNFITLKEKEIMIENFYKILNNDNQFLFKKLKNYNIFICDLLYPDIFRHSGGKLKTKKGGVEIHSEMDDKIYGEIESKIDDVIDDEIKQKKIIEDYDKLISNYIISDDTTLKELKELKELKDCYKDTYDYIEKQKKNRIKREEDKSKEREERKIIDDDTIEILLKDINTITEHESSDKEDVIDIIHTYISELNTNSALSTGGFNKNKNKKKYIRKLKRY
jgi:hypothetical protein